MLQNAINVYADKLVENVPDLISVSLVSTENAEVLAYRTVNNEDNRKASQYQIEIFKNAIRSFENTEGLHDKNVQNVSIFYQGQVHLTSISAGKKILLHLVLKEMANVPLIRMIVEKLREEMIAKYPEMAGL